jgi:HMG (high mobility group) box
MEMREIIRAEHPGAVSTQVEKLVGQRWARLTPEKRQRYVEVLMSRIGTF